MAKFTLFRNFLFAILCKIFVLFSLQSCRGQKSEKPPILPIQNMVEQTSFAPQSKNDFYKDKMAMRPPVPGTIAQGEEKSDKSFYEGIDQSSSLHSTVWIQKIPLKLTAELLKKGQEEYNVYCAPCHGLSGDSDGLVTQRAGGVIRPSHLHDHERLVLPVGKIYDAIRNGVNNGNMPGFSAQMTAEERWAVVAYVRVLQKSRRVRLDQIPEDVRIENGWSDKK
jgi:mono/diheme cytochrome c family protein